MTPHFRPVSSSEAREADREASQSGAISSLVLMEHAGKGLAELVRSLRNDRRPVAIVCGPGSNGGDGYACARFLLAWGIPVHVLRAATSLPHGSDSAIEHALVAAETSVEVVGTLAEVPVLDRALSTSGLVVDALFGIGLTRPLTAPYLEWIERINRADAVRVSADIPSGLDADTGEPLPVAVRAHVTAAMGFAKKGCVTPRGAAYAGRIVELDIGLPGFIRRRFEPASRKEA